VLRRKLRTVDAKNARNREKWQRDSILALCSLYGIDLLADNVSVCRTRLLGIASTAHETRFKSPLPDGHCRAAAFILSKNIVQGDALTLQTADHRPIVFPEWSPMNGRLIKRRDYAYRELLSHDDFELSAHQSDSGKSVFLPKPVGDYTPTHYLKVAEQRKARS
jgi:hypothetical protein